MISHTKTVQVEIVLGAIRSHTSGKTHDSLYSFRADLKVVNVAVENNNQTLISAQLYSYKKRPTQATLVIGIIL